MRYRTWHALFGFACWLATHRLPGPGRFVMKRAHRLWLDEWSPDW